MRGSSLASAGSGLRIGATDKPNFADSAQTVGRVAGDLSAVAQRAKAEAVTRLFNVSDGGLRRSLSSGRALRGPVGLQSAYWLLKTRDLMYID